MKAIRILKKIGKWAGISLLTLFVIITFVYLWSLSKFNKEYHKEYNYPPISMEIPYDSAAIAKGKHLYTVYGCRECHGIDLRGKVMINDPLLGYVKSANLTSGKGGVPSDFNDEDWLRALKHGIGKNGRSLIVMPSIESSKIPDEDLANLIAYCKNAPPVDNDLGELNAGPLAKVLFGIGQLDIFSITGINHDIEPINKPEETISPEFGATLTINCTGCHRSNFEGGPPLAPGHPPVPNITSTGRPGKWSEEQFIRTLRTGMTPDGHKLDNDLMPWKRFGEYSDVELRTIRAYLLSYPKTPKNLTTSAN